MSGCISCGACCYPIICPTRESLAKNPHQGSKRDRDFVMKELIPISISEALRRNPFLALRGRNEGKVKIQGDILKGLTTSSNYRFYECPYFDLKNHLCKIHGTDKKPPVCRDYPVYSKSEKAKAKSIALATPFCGYRQHARVNDTAFWNQSVYLQEIIERRAELA